MKALRDYNIGDRVEVCVFGYVHPNLGGDPTDRTPHWVPATVEHVNFREDTLVIRYDDRRVGSVCSYTKPELVRDLANVN